MEGGGETCVFPDVHASKMPNIPWRKSGNGWYSSLRGGFKVKVLQSVYLLVHKLNYNYKEAIVGH